MNPLSLKEMCGAPMIGNAHLNLVEGRFVLYR